MLQEVIITIYLFMWFALVMLTVLFIISGLDDLFIDCWYWVRSISRRFKMRKYAPLTYKQLNSKKEQAIAVLIPCWQESQVISTMLHHNLSTIDYTNYVLFVGLYPNDPKTIQAAQQAITGDKRVYYAIGEKPGPTNKACNLNQIYNALKNYEKEHNTRFDIILFHDAEDIIHPLSFKLYNHIIPRKDMVQLPIFPLRVPHWNFTHWLYVDEFSENHTKDIIVRESIKAHIPSAGVGTAFARYVIEALETISGKPFSEDSLTEDYRTSYIIRTLGFKQIFLTQSILATKWVKSGFFKRRYKEKVIKLRVATRAMFPTSYFQSVRQKTRWIIGIVFQEWEASSWPKSWRLRYSLFHDRKAFFTHFISGGAYLVFSFWILYAALTQNHPEYPSLQEQFNLHPSVWILVSIASLMMVDRLVQRFIATTRLYGPLAGILSIPRIFYGNILNLHALLRAYAFYFVSVKDKKKPKPVKWDKTEHHFPGQHPLVHYKTYLGESLVQAKLISQEQLQQALTEQYTTGERLGAILKQHGWLSQKDLTLSLAKQYKLPIIPHSQAVRRADDYAKKLPKKLFARLRKYHVHAVHVSNSSAELTLGILDPTNEALITDILKHTSAYHVRFALLDMQS